MVWIEDQIVENALKAGDTHIVDEAIVKYCMSNDNTYCVVIREHSAWYVDGDGWNEGNFPPKKGEEGREMLNFYKKQVGDDNGFWFKVFIPSSVKIIELKTISNDKYVIKTDKDQYELNYNDIDGLMWDLMSGTGVEEDEIESNFKLLCRAT